ncbi:MAG: mannonate dehydratase [Pseudomonadota bacterium]
MTNAPLVGLEQTWRWYGPSDPVTLDDVRQAGASGIVTALHETYNGEAWSSDDIAARKRLIEDAGLSWSVVESIPVHPSINSGSQEAAHFTEAFATSMERCAEQGLLTICYNLMPVVDWTRTDLRYRLSSGGLALRYDAIDFAAYDVFILKRMGAESDYRDEVLQLANDRADGLTDEHVAMLEATIIAGLPGSELSHDRESLLHHLSAFDGFDHALMLENVSTFLRTVVPRAEACGARLCLHPDDPPMDLFGIPRVASTPKAYQDILDAAPSVHNGVTLCVGSLSSRADNDLDGFINAIADRIHFVHLRNVKRQDHGSFYESDHLDGDADMVSILRLLMQEQARRQAEGRADWEIPMRPDHGHVLLDDMHKKTNPGYSAIGRLKGLAELRGVMAALAA